MVESSLNFKTNKSRNFGDLAVTSTTYLIRSAYAPVISSGVIAANICRQRQQTEAIRNNEKDTQPKVEKLNA